MHADSVVSQTGVAPEQSALVAQATQSCARLHTGFGAEQSALVRHSTHSFATVSHFGAAGLVQSLSTVQTTQEPAFIPVVTQAWPPGFPTQSASVAHGPHVCVVELQVGFEPLQSELNSQSTHVPVGKSQTSTPPTHAVAFVDEHWPHAPQTSHAGVLPLQFESEEHALQTPPVQMGVSPPQSDAPRHCTQTFVELHRGVAGGQLASTTQTTQSPLFGPVVAHSGVAPPQSALPAHARHASAVASQMGVGLAQPAFVRQPTHVLTGTSHTGVVTGHPVAFVAEQIAQTPDAAHAGVAPPQAESPSHAHGTPFVLMSSS